MRVLVVSGELIGSSICHQLVREGHDVKLYIEREGWKDCLENIITKVSDWKAELNWVGKEGLVIFDDVGFGKDQDRLRKEGYTVVGGSEGADELEFNRDHFHQLLKENDIAVLKSKDFNTIDSAIEFIKKNPAQWVLKQSTHVGMLNYVGERHDGKDTISVLRSYKKYNINNVHLQERVNGIEIGVARYFNGTNWVGPIEMNHEFKRLCNDDVGPLTHEMGTVIWYSEDESMPLYAKTLARLETHLRKIDFRGDIDINCIVNEDGIWPLEATPRFGNPSMPLQCALNKSSLYDFLFAVGSGADHKLKYNKGYGVVVSVALPPFPNAATLQSLNEVKNENVLLSFTEDFKQEMMKNVHLEEISKKKLGGEDVFYWAGTDGWVLHVTGTGSTIPEAQKEAYKVIDNIILPKKFYRTDIGTRVSEHDLPQLAKWGMI